MCFKGTRKTAHTKYLVTREICVFFNYKVAYFLIISIVIYVSKQSLYG